MRNKCLYILVCLLCLLQVGCSDGEERTADGRLVISYWEKWSGFELEAMQEIVDRYNASQSEVFVRLLPVSQIDHKLLLATAGGNPPDVAGLWSHSVHRFSEKGALLPLNKPIERAGIEAGDYANVFWDLCSHRGYVWALPSTPATLALHWNKRLFEEAGLDGDVPPRSLEELDEMGDKLTIVGLERDGNYVEMRYTELTQAEKDAKDFDLIQVGHLPTVPGWFSDMWVYWFGGNLVDAGGDVSANEAANIAAFVWYQKYTKKYGLDNVRRFSAGFGSFASPQDAFLSGKVAMVLQGVWLHNFITMYSPNMSWGAAPFPSVDAETMPIVTIAECDVLVVPRGAKHAKEGFDFIAFVQKQENMELLCLNQRKFSPLSNVSEAFVEKHPNPYIGMFMEMAKSEGARYVPKTPMWGEYKTEIVVALEKVGSLKGEPNDVLDDLQKRMKVKFDRQITRWNAVEVDRKKQWAEEDAFGI